MKFFLRIAVLVLITDQYTIQSAPFTKTISLSKKFHFELKPFKSFSFLIENLPFGKFELKHSIEKRDTGSVSPAFNEIPLIPIEERKVPVQAIVVPEVILEPSKQDGLKTYSFMMPWAPEFVIKPNQEAPLAIEPAPRPPAPVVETLPVLTSVVEITHKPIDVLPVVAQPVAVQPVVAQPVHVVVTSPSETPVAPAPAPVFVTEKDPITTPLHTDITKVPLYSLIPAYPATQVPILQEIIAIPPTTLLPPPLPPPPKEETPAPPVAPPTEERPNYLVKGSRLILFFGTKILHMLSKFIEGGVNKIASMPSFPVVEQ